jgi:hypothetical protein
MHRQVGEEIRFLAHDLVFELLIGSIFSILFALSVLFTDVGLSKFVDGGPSLDLELFLLSP